MQSKTVSEILPARETILLIEQPNVEAIERLQKWFPMLTDVEVSETTEAIALVRLPNEQIELLIFARGKQTQDTNAIMESFSPFTVLSSSQEVLMLLQHTKGFLSQFAPFQDLTRVRNRESTWAYIRTDAMTLSSELQEDLSRSLLFTNARFVGITQEQNGLRIDATDQTIEIGKYISRPSILWSAEAPLLSVHLQDPTVAFSSLLNHISEQEKTISQGLLAKQIYDALGQGISIEFDILPALRNEVALELWKGESGEIQFIVGTETNTAKEATELEEKIRLSVRGQTLSTEIRTRLFDGRFPAKDIRIAQQDSEQEPEQIGDWIVWSNESETIITALNDKQIVVSNSKKLLETLRAPAPSTNEGQTAFLISEGQIHIHDLLKTLQTIVPSLNKEAILTIPQDRIIHWKTTGRDHMRSIQIKWDEKDERESI